MLRNHSNLTGPRKKMKKQKAQGNPPIISEHFLLLWRLWNTWKAIHQCPLQQTCQQKDIDVFNWPQGTDKSYQCSPFERNKYTCSSKICVVKFIRVQAKACKRDGYQSQSVSAIWSSPEITGHRRHSSWKMIKAKYHMHRLPCLTFCTLWPQPP